jgi:hypothetical protein
VSGYEIDDRDYDEFEADRALWLGADEQHREWVVRFSDGGFEATFIGSPQDSRGRAQAELDRMRAEQRPGDDLDGRYVDVVWRLVGPWHAEHEDDPGVTGLEAFVDGWVVDGPERTRESALVPALRWDYETPETQVLRAGRQTTQFSIRRIRLERAEG